MRSIINEILTEGRVEDAKALIAKSFLPDEEHDYAEMVDYLVDNDPSGNNKYLMWMGNRMIDDNEDTTDNTEGALIDLEICRSSFSRGTPRVTLDLAETPAK